ncbi:MAG: hypothetical protein ACKOZY_04995 [Flavobacteriales bacterium]
MRNNVVFIQLILASALFILVDLRGIAGDLFLPPSDSICEGNAVSFTHRVCNCAFMISPGNYFDQDN